MEVIKTFFRFIINHYEIIVFLLLSIAVVSLSLRVSKQQQEINSLKKIIYSEPQIEKKE